MSQARSFWRYVLLAYWVAAQGIGVAHCAPEDVWDDTISAGLAALQRQDIGAATRAFERAARDAQYLDHDRQVVSLTFLGETYLRSGEYVKAEAASRRALQIVDDIPGINPRERAVTANNLAAALDAQGRFRQAEELYRRAVEIYLGTGDVPLTELYTTLSNLAGVEVHLERPRRAEWLYRLIVGLEPDAESARRADVGVMERRLETRLRNTNAPASLEAAVAALNNLGALLAREDRLGEAEWALEQAHTQATRVPALAHQAAAAAHNRGVVLERLGRQEMAGAMLEAALKGRTALLGERHPDVALTRYAIAQHLSARGDAAGALGHARAALEVLAPYLSSEAAATERATTRIATMRQWREAFETHLMVLQRFSGQAGDRWKEEAFRVMQLAKASDTAATVADMARRFAAGDGRLSEAMRERQETLSELNAVEQALSRIAALAPAERESGALRRLEADAGRMQNLLRRLDAEIGQRAGTKADSVTLAATQTALRPNEALLAYLTSTDRTHLVVVTREAVEFLMLAVPRSEVNLGVRRLRTHLDDVRAAAERGLTGDGAQLGTAYPTDVAHLLYEKLLAPAAAHLGNVRDLLIVPDGELESLPFAMLLRRPEIPSIESAALQKYSWLVRDYSMGYLPALDTLISLRSLGPGAGGRESFVAFADPILSDGPAAERGIRPRFAALVRSGTIADVSRVRALSSLPETAEEVRAVASSLGAPASALYLRERATEARIKALPLQRYQVLMFATHGLMSGEVRGIGEPALVLTPPARGSAEDDGLLTASEIARLKLDADWVILSACNTAETDGTPGAEAYSGLARAFFHAGARALLVSHWAVASEPTVTLTTRIFESMRTDPTLTRAQALRVSMLDMVDRPSNPAYSHPFFWAPFVVVGNSGR